MRNRGQNEKDNNPVLCMRTDTKGKNGEYDGIKREIIRTGKVSHGYCPEDFKKAMKQ